MCAWDATKPAASGYLVSADIRANWAAVEDQHLGRNLLGDPDFSIWAAGTSGDIPSWWNLSGQTSGGNISRFTSTTAITVPGANSAVKLTYDSTLELYQNVISTGDITTSIKSLFDGQSIAAGAYIYTDSADTKLVMHGPSSDVVSSAVPASTWTWMSNTLQLVSSTVTRVGMGVKINATGDAYIACPTLVLGPIPPDYYIPSPPVIGTVGTVLAGDPLALTTDGDGAFVYSHQLPFRVERVDMRALTGCTTANLIIDCQHDTGTSWPSIYSATSNTTKPQLTSVGSGVDKSDGAAPDGSYWLRCFAADTSGTSPANSTVNLKVIQAPGTGGKNPTIKIRALTYAPPLTPLRAQGAYK